MNDENISFNKNDITVGRAAMLLALTASREEEEKIKGQIEQEKGYRCAVTEVGGKVNDFKEKITNAVIGAALNCGVIEKDSRQVHALLHATMEAENGMLFGSAIGLNLAVKVGIASDNEWIAVALFGQSGAHFLTSHERAGFGLMHLTN